MATTQVRKAAPKTAPKTAPKNETEYGERISAMLSGNVTMDPEMRFTPSGRPVCTLSVAVNDRVKNEDTGQWEDTETVFWRCTAWNKLGEQVAENVTRGMRVVMTGYEQERTYTNKDGERITVTEFTATDLGVSVLFKNVRVNEVSRSR